MRKKKTKIAIVVSLIVLCMNNIVLSKYNHDKDLQVNTKIAKPIIVVEKDEVIKTKVDQNSFPIEYNFSICNYNDTEVNEVDFSYTIEIENSVENFPVSYVLMDCDKNEEIKLTDGKSEPISISKSTKEIKNFKLYLQWREMDVDLADNVQINLKINAIQSKEEKEI